jgi:integrase/recombinase XerD
MSPLRQRMIQDLQLRGFSARTQECYVAAVRQLSEHDHASPDQLAEEHLRHHFLNLANEKKAARATCQTGQKSTPLYSPEVPNPR